MQLSEATGPRYIAGLIKVFIIALLVLSFGAPTFRSVFAWFVLAALVGYSYALHNELKIVAVQQNPAPTENTSEQLHEA